MELFFLPKFPVPVSDMVLVGIILIAGLLGGRVVSTSGYLPRIFGYIAIGFLVGPNALDWLNRELIGHAQLFVDLALGLILFQLGRRLDFHWLRHDRWLVVTGALECILTFAAVYFALVYLRVEPLHAALAAAIAISTSPEVLLLVAGDLKAEGQVTSRAISLVAINNVVAFIVFTVLLSPLHLTFGASSFTMVLHPLYLLAGSLVLGFVAFAIMLVLGRVIGKQEAGQFILLVGVILLAVGGAETLNLSVVLTMLALGIMSKNLDRRHDLMEIELGYASQLFFVVLFVIVGATIDLRALLRIGWVVPAFIVGRFVGKMIAVFAFARLSRLSAGRALMLGISLVPMAAIAMGMTATVSSLYPQFGAQLAAIVVSSIAILEIIGPIATQYALKRAREAHPEQQG